MSEDEVVTKKDLREFLGICVVLSVGVTFLLLWIFQL